MAHDRRIVIKIARFQVANGSPFAVVQQDMNSVHLAHACGPAAVNVDVAELQVDCLVEAENIYARLPGRIHREVIKLDGHGIHQRDRSARRGYAKDLVARSESEAIAAIGKRRNAGVADAAGGSWCGPATTAVFICSDEVEGILSGRRYVRDHASVE